MGHGVTYPHASKRRERLDGLVHKLGNERITVLLQLLALQLPAQFLDRFSRVDDPELPHKHNHGIYDGRVALELMYSLLADLIQEVVEWRTKEKNLQNLNWH